MHHHRRHHSSTFCAVAAVVICAVALAGVVAFFAMPHHERPRPVVMYDPAPPPTPPPPPPVIIREEGSCDECTAGLDELAECVASPETTVVYVDDAWSCVNCHPRMWFRDLDGDGLGDPACAPRMSCEPSEPFTADNGDDPDDSEPNTVFVTSRAPCDGPHQRAVVRGPGPGGHMWIACVDCGTTWHIDLDGDGLGDPGGVSVASCQPPATGGPWVPNALDADDSSACRGGVCLSSPPDACTLAPAGCHASNATCRWRAIDRDRESRATAVDACTALHSASQGLLWTLDAWIEAPYPVAVRARCPGREPVEREAIGGQRVTLPELHCLPGVLEFASPACGAWNVSVGNRTETEVWGESTACVAI